MKNLYVVSSWVPFPESEYGGLHVVVASTDEEALDLLLPGEWERGYRGAACMEQIEAAGRFTVSADEQSRVVRSFTT